MTPCLLFQFAVLSLAVQRSTSVLENPEAFTNLTHIFAIAGNSDLSSVANQGSLPGIDLGSSGANAGDDIGAASSYGLTATKLSHAVLGVAAAQAKSSDATSGVQYSQIGPHYWLLYGTRRVKRDATSADTNIQAVSGTNSDGTMGSTGVQAGPVATSISLGALLIKAGESSYTAVNSGAAAAHAGDSDSTYTFSNSDLAVTDSEDE